MSPITLVFDFSKQKKKFFFLLYINRTPNNIYIGQMKISKFTMINKQIIFTSAKQTLFMTIKIFALLSNLLYDLYTVYV